VATAIESCALKGGLAIYIIEGRFVPTR